MKNKTFMLDRELLSEIMVLSINYNKISEGERAKVSYKIAFKSIESKLEKSDELKDLLRFIVYNFGKYK